MYFVPVCVASAELCLLGSEEHKAKVRAYPLTQIIIERKKKAATLDSLKKPSKQFPELRELRPQPEAGKGPCNKPDNHLFFENKYLFNGLSKSGRILI